MRNYYRVAHLISSIFLFSIGVGCGPEQQVKPPPPLEYSEPACIQGTVKYSTSVDSNPVPFSRVKITAWRHGTEQSLAETTADGAGNYCIEVPLGDFGVDLRIWGMVHLGSKSYTCTGSADNINLGTTSKKCGEDCMEVDIVAECKEFRPIRRRK